MLFGETADPGTVAGGDLLRFDQEAIMTVLRTDLFVPAMRQVGRHLPLLFRRA